MITRIQPIATATQLGTLLQGARKSRKLTQAQLAERLGLSQRRIFERNSCWFLPVPRRNCLLRALAIQSLSLILASARRRFER